MFNLPLLNRLETLAVVLLIPLCFYVECLHPLLQIDRLLPFLPLLLTSVYCSILILYCWLRLHLIEASGEDELTAVEATVQFSGRLPKKQQKKKSSWLVVVLEKKDGHCRRRESSHDATRPSMDPYGSSSGISENNQRPKRQSVERFRSVFALPCSICQWFLSPSVQLFCFLRHSPLDRSPNSIGTRSSSMVRQVVERPVWFVLWWVKNSPRVTFNRPWVSKQRISIGRFEWINRINRSCSFDLISGMSDIPVPLALITLIK